MKIHQIDSKQARKFYKKQTSFIKSLSKEVLDFKVTELKAKEREQNLLNALMDIKKSETQMVLGFINANIENQARKNKQSKLSFLLNYINKSNKNKVSEEELVNQLN